MDQTKSLTPLGTVVLTLLSEHPMHPYEAAYHFRVRRVENSVKVRTGSLYHAFEQLQRKGLVEPAEVERDGRRPERTVYRITEAGRIAMEANLTQLVTDPVDEYTNFEAGLVGIAHLGRDEVVRCFRERAIRLRARAAEQESILRDHVALGLPKVYMLEVDYQIDQCRAQATWCDRTAAALESEELPWPAGLPDTIEHLVSFSDNARPKSESRGAERKEIGR